MSRKEKRIICAVTAFLNQGELVPLKVEFASKLTDKDKLWNIARSKMEQAMPGKHVIETCANLTLWEKNENSGCWSIIFNPKDDIIDDLNSQVFNALQRRGNNN